MVSICVFERRSIICQLVPIVRTIVYAETSMATWSINACSSWCTMGGRRAICSS